MDRNNPKGFALIYLIFIMLALGGMGAAIYSFTTSSAYTELTENNRNRAYQLAQTGLNYAANCLTGNDPSCTTDLTTLHNRTFTLNNNRGQFSFTASKLNPPTGTAYYDVTSIGTVNGNDGLQLARAQVRSCADPSLSDPNNPCFFRAEPPFNQQASNTTFENLNWFNQAGLKDADNHTMIRIRTTWPPGDSTSTGPPLPIRGPIRCPTRTTRDATSAFMWDKQTPICTNRSSRSWNDYNHVNYDIQAKMGWYMGLSAAVSGLNFRWHEVVSGKFEGYGLSFMRYTYSAAGCGAGYDFIPNSIKPPGLANHLLLVLWEQRVVGGAEHRRWLAYADLGTPALYPNPRLGNDPKVLGAQDNVDGLLNDDSLLLVRVKENFVQGQRVNEINIFYGDASPYYNAQRTPDRSARIRS